LPKKKLNYINIIKKKKKKKKKRFPSSNFETKRYIGNSPL